MSAPSPASARDAPCDGRPSASAARSHRPAPLEAARHRFGAASLSRAALASGGPTMPRASTGETGPAMVGPRRAEPAFVAGALAVASSAVRTLPGPGGGGPQPTARPTFSAPRPPRAASRFGRVRAGVANVPSPVFLDGSPVRLPPAPAGRASARKNNVKSPRREEPSEAVPGDAVCCRRPDGGKGCAINRAKYPPLSYTHHPSTRHA